MCINPVSIKQEGYNPMQVPCGKCCECKERRSAMWAFRLLQQEKASLESHFVTLTYADENLPPGGTLVKADLQNFFKRLRKKCQLKVKYYACGEYGSDTKRPHYHAVIFNASDRAIISAWSLDDAPIGHVHFGDVGSASIRYVTNYITKSVGSHPVGTLPEFSVMSKGLGLAYLTRDVVAWHNANLANYVVLDGGVKQVLPRYFKLKIFDEYQRECIAQEHRTKYEQRLEAVIEKYTPSGYQKLLKSSRKQRVLVSNYKQLNRNKL